MTLPAHLRAARLLGMAASFVLTVGAGVASAGDDIFFEQLPEGYEATIRRCVDEGACEAIAALSPGPQYRAVAIWDRKITDAFPVESSEGRLLVDAAEFEQLIGRYYRWPADAPKQGEVDIRGLPGLEVQEQDAMLTLYPLKGFTREMTFGGQRVVAPEEFDRPGTAMFGEFRARFDTAFGTEDDAHGRLDSVLGAQAGFWQLVSETWIATDEAFSVRQAYAERPILAKALRLRTGLIDATGCDMCFSGRMVGVSLGTDSLQGLLYSPRDMTYLDVTVGGEIDDIEIVVNGRKVRTERAFPGFHTVAVTALVGGVNIIEVYGVDRETGHRRLLASEERLASPTLLGKGRVEWQAEAGWALGDEVTFDDDPDWEEPFVQFTRAAGLGGGRQLGSELMATPKALLAEESLSMPLGGGRLEVFAAGTATAKAFGGGAGIKFADGFGPVRVGAGAELCYDCFDPQSFKVKNGLDTQLQAYLSTPLLGWAVSASAYYSTDDAFGWNASLRRGIKGGTIELFAHESSIRFHHHGSGRDDPDLKLGLRFTRLLGGERPGSIETSLERDDGKWRGRAAYSSLPSGGEGIFYGADVETDDPSHDDAEPSRLAGNLGYQDDLVLASGNASYGGHNGEGRLGLNATTGFVLTDGEFIVTRSARSGGVFASDLTPGSTVVGDAGEIGRVDYLGQAHLNSLTRGEISRVLLDEGLIDGSPSTREAELLMVPGLIYGIGDGYQHQERTYQISIVPAGRAPAAGTVLLDETGSEIGYSGYDGIVTVDTRAKSLSFEYEDQVCHVVISGSEPEVDGLSQLVATCTMASQGPNGESDPTE